MSRITAANECSDFYCGDESCREMKALTRLAHKFGAKMVDRLLEKLNQGYHGWDQESSWDTIMDRLEAAVDEGRWIDVANLAAMLWNLKQEG